MMNVALDRCPVDWWRSTVLWGVAGFLLAGSSAYGQTNASEAEPQSQQEVDSEVVRKLLRELEADQLQVRDAAEKQLIQIGPAVVPRLPSINARTSGEMKIRLQRIRAALQQSDVASFFESSTVTLSGKMSLEEALKEISRQTGNPIELRDSDAFADFEVELSAEDEEFWTVIKDILSQSSLRIDYYGSTENQLMLVAGGDYAVGGEAMQPFRQGPFVVEAVSAQSMLPFGSQLGGQLTLSIRVAWEPRLEPVFMQVPMQRLEVVVEGQETLMAANQQATLELRTDLGTPSSQVDLQIQRPARAVSQIDRLSGQFTIAVPGARHKYVFKKFGNEARQSEKYGDVQVTLDGARRNGAVYEMRLLVEFGNAQGALESFRGWILSNEAYLLDSQGARLENVGYQTYAASSNAVGIAYLFQINGDPNSYELVYESPGAITKQTVDYELTNIPLP